MSTLADVHLWGTSVGTVALADGADVAVFEYDRAFLSSGIEITPLVAVRAPVRRWLYFAERAGLAEGQARALQATFCLV